MTEPSTEFIHNGWKFTYNRGNISNTQQIEQFESQTNIHCPEMVYLNNTITVTHIATNTTIVMNTNNALLRCQQIYHAQENNDSTIDNMPVPSIVQVIASDKWSTKQLQQSIVASNMHIINKINVDDIGVVKLPYDWTYTTDYLGTINTDLQTTEQHINIAMLQQRDPILWYCEIPLYDDELHDNGISTLNVKCRVMDKCFLILLTYFLRVDNVIIRIYETRIFHQFDLNTVIREHTRYECMWTDLPKYHLPTNAAMLTEVPLITRKLKPTYNIRQSFELPTNT